MGYIAAIRDQNVALRNDYKVLVYQSDLVQQKVSSVHKKVEMTIGQL